MKLAPILAVAGLFAQDTAFNALATGEDGSVVYFSTRLRQSGTNQASYGKIFRATEQGVELAEWRERVASGVYELPTNYYDLLGPLVSDAGELIGVNAWRECNGNATTFCWTRWTSTTLRGKFYENGTGWITGNGRWLVQVRTRPLLYRMEVTLHDLITARRVASSYLAIFWASPLRAKSLTRIQTPERCGWAANGIAKRAAYVGDSPERTRDPLFV